jgi:hypothetical protein
MADEALHDIGDDGYEQEDAAQVMAMTPFLKVKLRDKNS